MSDPHTIDEGAQLTRGHAPVGAVTVYRHMVYEGRLVHALDYVVLLHLLFATTAGQPLTPPMLWRELQEQGIRSAKNANELVGKNAIYDAFTRLIGAGFVRRVEIPNDRPGRRPSIGYEVYDNPAWNPDWQAQQTGSDPLEPNVRHSGVKGNPQVSPLPGTPEVADGENHVSAGQPTSRNAGSGVPGSGVPGSGERRVPAGRPTSRVPGSGGALPPHPPEGEVGTTSPSPHKPATASRKEKQQPEAPAEAVAAARTFLMSLPGAWSAPLQRADNLAPWLVRNAELTGWKLDMALRLYLTRDEPGKPPVNNYPATLGYRIKYMQMRDAVMQAAIDAEASAVSEPETTQAPGIPAWCGQCNGGETPLALYMRTRPVGGIDSDQLEQCPDCHPAMVRKARV